MGYGELHLPKTIAGWRVGTREPVDLIDSHVMLCLCPWASDTDINKHYDVTAVFTEGPRSHSALQIVETPYCFPPRPSRMGTEREKAKYIQHGC